MNQQLQALYIEMINYFSGDPRRIQHWIKVHSLAKQIALGEGLEEHALFIFKTRTGAAIARAMYRVA